MYELLPVLIQWWTDSPSVFGCKYAIQWMHSKLPNSKSSSTKFSIHLVAHIFHPIHFLPSIFITASHNSSELHAFCADLRSSHSWVNDNHRRGEKTPGITTHELTVFQRKAALESQAPYSCDLVEPIWYSWSAVQDPDFNLSSCKRTLLRSPSLLHALITSPKYRTNPCENQCCGWYGFFTGIFKRCLHACDQGSKWNLTRAPVLEARDPVPGTAR